LHKKILSRKLLFSNLHPQHACKIRVNLRALQKTAKTPAQNLRHGPVDGLHLTETKSNKSLTIFLTKK